MACWSGYNLSALSGYSAEGILTVLLALFRGTEQTEQFWDVRIISISADYLSTRLNELNICRNTHMDAIILASHPARKLQPQGNKSFNLLTSS